MFNMPKPPNFLKAALSIAGFTMIELLIVIAILGILAVAVLAAINPVEQINRGRDTASRSDAEQFIGGIDRFNAFQGYYPWQSQVGATGRAMPWTQVDNSLVDDAATPCPIYEKLSQATTAGCTGTDELKVTFFTKIFAASYNPMFVYNRGQQGDSTYVCFTPVSKAFLTEATNRCVDAAGSGLPGDIDAATRTTICGTSGAEMICLP
jgi:prepilin-type N-terminal cleavage/methylation domain-containing protein